MPSNHLILCRPLLLPPSIFPSIRVSSNETALPSRWPKYWSFSFSISPSNEYSGLISLRVDWLNPLAVQGSLKSLLHHHSSKASILQCLDFFIVQLSHPYMPTGKTIALTRWAFVGKVMSLNTIEKIYIYTHMHTHIFIHTFYIYAIVVQLFTCVRLFATHGLQHPGLPVHHYLPEFTQTHVHCVGDAIQPSHPLSSPSPPALNLFHHQGLFK